MLINEAIIKGRNLDYILKVSELAIQYGFNINKKKASLVVSMLSSRRNIQSIIDVYVFSSKYGYDDLANDVKYHNNFLPSDIHKHDAYEYVRIEGFKIMFTKALEKIKIVNKQINFTDDDIKMMLVLEIIMYIQNFLNCLNRALINYLMLI